MHDIKADIRFCCLCASFEKNEKWWSEKKTYRKMKKCSFKTYRKRNTSQLERLNHSIHIVQR